MRKYLIYKTTNKNDGKYYIGAHETVNINDSYLGSGLHLKRAIKKYGKDCFVRETLIECSNREEMFTEEQKLVQIHLENPLCYNVKEGGRGGWNYINKNVNKRFENTDERLKVSKQFKDLWKNEDYRKNNIAKNIIEKSTPMGKIRQKLSALKSWETRDKNKFSETMKIINGSIEKRLDASKKLKQKMNTPEYKEKMKNRRTRGAFLIPHYWWNDGITQTMSSVCPVGYVKGRLKMKNRRIRRKK